ncbi:KIN14B-interacting protein At4g14310 [Silene latifolia]|uniref:KIN14B-interacting protein At4g14310 n=1 Tax=Silene latifolia TaxID=37657 RepID=UPI003D78572C
MSSQSVRRLKERGGSGGKVVAPIPSKTLIPISENPSLIASGRKSIGKENPNPNPKLPSRVSGQTQKPVIRPMVKMSGVENRSKSQPRGRSASPSDFTRVLSDMRKNRVSSGNNLGRSEVGNGGSRVLEKTGLRGFNPKTGERSRVGEGSGIKERKFGSLGMNLSDEFRKEGDLCVNLVKQIANEAKGGSERRVVSSSKGGSGMGMNLSDDFGKEGALCVNLVKQIASEPKIGSERRVVGISKGGSFVVGGDDGRAQKGKTLDENIVMKDSCRIGVSSERRGLELNGKGSGVKNGEGSSGRVASKSASRLHEKLAYLEGKVKRIACDIKKTKEMLDMNNTDASKLILSDIQEKISGIEKAVGSVMADSNTHVTGACSGVSGNSNNGEIIDSLCQTLLAETKWADSEKASVKGLNSQELEARLFPHHKLLRSRTLSSISGNNILESNSVSKIEDNLIQNQFLASLSNAQAEVISTKHGEVVMMDEIKATEEPQSSTAQGSYGTLSGMQSGEVDLEAHERLDELYEQENKPMVVEDEMEEDSVSQLVQVGRKTSTAGWFVSEGEAVLLAHDDGTCSFHDIVNYEEKAEYIPPPGLSENIWRDCWIVRAPGAESCSAKYVVAASAGSTMESGFCSWDFYTKDVRAFHIEDNNSSRVPLSPLPDNIMRKRNPLSGLRSNENRQWWYRPSGPLIISTASCQNRVKVFDIRDGDIMMKWDVQKPVLSMDYSSPLQWRNREKVVVAETEGLSLWDVSSQNSQALSSVSTSGRRISALHINNTDAELGGGVRQRTSSSEAEGNDGVFCTSDSINILDFRQPSGIGLKIPKIGVTVQSISSRGDSVFLGCNNVISAQRKQVNSQVLQFSVRKQKIVNTYNLPESNAHSHHRALTQVWGNSDWVMAVSGLGLFVFDAQKDDELPSFVSNYNGPQNVREIIGPDDMYSPSFDYHSSQVLLVSRDRPAMWRQLS